MGWFKTDKEKLVEAKAEYDEIMKHCTRTQSQTFNQENDLRKLAKKIALLKERLGE